MFSLEKVDTGSQKHINGLFDILCSRKYNISHKQNPNFQEHENFVKNNPYRKWYLIINANRYEGTIYITYSNIIGVNLTLPTVEKYKDAINLVLKNHKPLKPIKSVRSAYFIINTNPYNNTLQKTLEELNFELIERSYAFIK
tara:strand:+ start:73 stop:498 length:426 start_codon:yes stop_codon:yes gene_type:complete